MIDVHMPQLYHNPDSIGNHLIDSDADENQGMDTLATRLSQAREESGLSQTELAERAGCSQGLVGNLETSRQQSSAKLPRMAQVLGVEALWLAEGKGPKKKNDAGKPAVKAVTPGDDRLPIRRVRFRLSAGVSGYEIEYDNGESEPIFMARRWFDAHHYRPEMLLAIKVTGRSMEPSLYDGDLVIVNTEDTALKDGCVFAANYEGELVIKRLRRDAGEWFLVSDSPDKRYYADKRCSDGCGLIGRIVYRQTEHI